MTARTGVDAAHFETSTDKGVAGLGLFDPPEPEECRHAHMPALSDRDERLIKALRIRDAKMARWITAGAPVALQVARSKGKVTAAMFRAEAELRTGVLPPTYGVDRTLSYLPAIFMGLVRVGLLTVAQHPNGDPIKEHDPETRNSHNVYLPTARAG